MKDDGVYGVHRDGREKLMKLTAERKSEIEELQRWVNPFPPEQFLN